WIQNWAPNLKSIWSSHASGGQGGATACQGRCHRLCQSLTDVQGRYHRPRQAVLPLQSGDWGGATAPARRFHRRQCTGAVLPPQTGGSTACVCVQGRCYRPRLGGSTAPGLAVPPPQAWAVPPLAPIRTELNGACLGLNLTQ
ncbi:unnamed protein product, partial [Musa textilis]